MDERRHTVAADGRDLRVTAPDGSTEGVPNAGYNLGRAMDLLAEVNGLRTRDGQPLHSLFMHAGHSLWHCQQYRLVYPFLQAYAQFPGLFDWLEARSWPSLLQQGALPGGGELSRALRALDSGTAGRLPAVPGAPGMAARLALPALWARSARKRRSRVLLYSPDLASDPRYGCDFRFAKVYAWLEKEGVPHAEIFHAIDTGTAWRNARKRGRIPLFLELWEADGKGGGPRVEDLDLSALAPSLAGLLRRILPGFFAACRTSAARVEGLRKAVRASGARLLVAMDDYRSSNELLIACRAEGIRTVYMQHGLVTRFHPGCIPAGMPEEVMAAPDRFLARAPFWKAVLERYAPRLAKAASVVGGLDSAAEGAGGNDGPPGDPLVVLFLLETLWDPAEAAPFLARMMADPRIRVHFKIRPDMDREKQVRPYFGSRQPHEVVLDLATEASRAHVVVGSHSSLLYKLLEWRKPVYRLITSFEYGEQLSRFGLVDDLLEGDDFHAVFRRALEREPAEYERRWLAYQGDGRFPDYGEALAEELTKAGNEGIRAGEAKPAPKVGIPSPG